MREMPGIYSFSKKCKPLCPSQISINKNLVAEVIRVLEKEYINPFSVLVVEECFFNLGSGIPVNNLLVDEILQIEEQKTYVCICNEEIGEKWSKEISWSVAKNKVTFIQKYYKVCNCKKNNKQRIVEVNRDILSWLINLATGSGLVAIYEMTMGYPLSPVPLSIAPMQYIWNLT